VTTDEVYIQRCLVLALRGLGHVSPNPMVGAVVVADGRIIGEGWHEICGQAHAEVNAIAAVEKKYPQDAPALLSKATIYVSLEPCAHHGKTPPCADLIILKKIPRVVVGSRDPFEAVNGKGIEKLINAGLDVTYGVLEAECREFNRRFFTAVEKRRPWIILKWAASSDGFLSPLPYHKYWLTSAISTQLVHQWRAQEDSILVGKTTALLDDPELTVRNFPGRNPLRLVIDWDLELPPGLKVFNSASPTLIFNGRRSGENGNLRYIHLEFREYLVPYLLYQLYMLDVRSVIIEGGRSILDLFIAAGLWDEARVFTSRVTLHKGLPVPAFNFSPIFIEPSGSDILRIYRRQDNP